MQHSFNIGTHKIRKGSDAPNTKLKFEQVEEIKELLKKGVSGRQIAKSYNISEGMISLIKHKKNWI